MSVIGHGVDLSHHQDPTTVPWDKFAGAVDFCICRASYGGGLRDRAVVEHMRRARQTGCKVGLYQFFRPSQSVVDHLAMFGEAAQLVGLGKGDIVPALDIELDPLPSAQPVSPTWEPRCRAIVEHLARLWGDCMVYITQREWGMLGKPAWVLDRPLWVAHYTTAATPASPGGRVPTIWQHRVGKFEPLGPGGYDKDHPDYDQNRLLGPLPIIGAARVDPDIDAAKVMGLVALTLDESIRGDGDDVRRGRFA